MRLVGENWIDNQHKFVMMRFFCGLLSVFILSLACAAYAQEANSTPNQSSHWVGSWAASQQISEPQNAIPAESLHNVTLRQIVRLSIGGSAIRVRISNAFGNSPLHCMALHVARPSSPATSRIDSASDRALTFNGSSEVTIPAGAEYLSDSLDYVMPSESDLAVTMYLDSIPGQETGHPGSRATSWLAHGSSVSATDLPNTQTLEHWYFLSGVDVEAPTEASAIVALGDSITDGHASTTNDNDRWTDDLARRLLKSNQGAEVSVLNEGIGGNRLLANGLGPNALARVNRDVFTQSGVRYLIVLEGVNDLGTLTRDGPATDAAHSELVRQIIESYVQIITQGHTHGLKVIGGTIMPFAGSNYYHPGPATEADRQSVNAWIRAAGHFDAVVDFDRVMADPARPDHLRPDYDCGDHLHPSATGYAAMANALSLNLFGK